MSLNPRHVPHVRLPRPTALRRWRLLLALVFSLALAATASGCGMNVQTSNPYTPAIGVNFDVGNVQIRDFMILSRTKGSGFLSATFTGNASDALLSVSGTMYKSDGSNGSPLTVTMSSPVAVGPVKPVVLTDRPLIPVTSADLEAGLTAKVVLRFSKAGEVTTNAPIVDATLPQYATISPSPSASPSA